MDEAAYSQEPEFSSPSWLPARLRRWGLAWRSLTRWANLVLWILNWRGSPAQSCRGANVVWQWKRSLCSVSYATVLTAPRPSGAP